MRYRGLRSSAGRAPPRHGGGRRFDTCRGHCGNADKGVWCNGNTAVSKAARCGFESCHSCAFLRSTTAVRRPVKATVAGSSPAGGAVIEVEVDEAPVRDTGGSGFESRRSPHAVGESWCSRWSVKPPPSGMPGSIPGCGTRYHTMDGGLLAGQRGSEPRLRRFDSCPSSATPSAGPKGKRGRVAHGARLLIGRVRARAGSNPAASAQRACGGLSRVRTTGRCLENSWGQGCPVRVRVPGPPPGRRHRAVTVVCKTTGAGAGPAGDSKIS
jgi:hypothetical protein